MLELRRTLAICRHDGPLIVERANIRLTSVNHRLDGKDHAHLDAQTRIGLAKMLLRRLLPKRATHPMTSQLAHGRESQRLGIRLDSSANVSQVVAWLRLRDAQFQAPFRRIHQPLRGSVHLADGEGAACVAHPSFIERANVNANDIAFLQHLAWAGDAVTDYLVDGNANRGGERRADDLAAPVTQRAEALIHRQRAALANEILGDMVKFAGSDARHDMRAQRLVGFRDDAASITEQGDILT